MSLDRSGKFQKAVLWEASGNDNYGEHKVIDPVQVFVRWEEGDQEVLDAQGNSISVNVTAWINQEVPVGSVMWLGALATIPASPTGLMEVVRCPQVPDVKGRHITYQLYLIRRSDTLPEIVSS